VPKRLSPSLILSVIAVVLALGGTATAASLITGKQIKNSSVTGADIKNKSLTPSDFSGSVKGDRGLQGIQGPSGAQGPAGITTVSTVNGPDVNVAPGDVGGADATCPAGSAVVGTGFSSSIGSIGFAERFGASVGIAVANDSSITIQIHAQAICAAGPGVSGARAVVRSDDRAQFDQAVADFRAARAK
jgi:hypothetical protein